MPSIYLSPSTQEFNPYIIGGNEEYYMNLIADAMEPYLYASGISFTRNTPDMTAASSIAQSNMGNYDLHLALHSNATGSGDGSRRGTEVYYYPTSVNGAKAAEIIANNLKLIYPLPQLVRTLPTTSLGEGQALCQRHCPDSTPSWTPSLNSFYALTPRSMPRSPYR